MILSCGTSVAHPLRVCRAYVAHQRRLLQLGPPNTTHNCSAAAKVPSERASWQCGSEAVRRCLAGARSAVQRRQQQKADKRCTLRYQSSRFHAPKVVAAAAQKLRGRCPASIPHMCRE